MFVSLSHVVPRDTTHHKAKKVCFVQLHLPKLDLSKWTSAQMGFVQMNICPNGICPNGYLSKWNCPNGRLSKWDLSKCSITVTTCVCCVPGPLARWHRGQFLMVLHGVVTKFDDQGYAIIDESGWFLENRLCIPCLHVRLRESETLSARALFPAQGRVQDQIR